MIGRREAMTVIAGGTLLPGIAFSAERRVVAAKIAIEDNRVLIGVEMNGKGPFVFMIDTGTYLSFIRPDVAKQIGLPVQARERSRGVGGSDVYTLYRASDFIIGGQIRQPTVMLSDAFDFGYRAGVQGALAAGVVTAMDTDLDFDAGELRVYPDGRGERPGYVAIDSSIPAADRGSSRIVVTVQLDGKPLRCILDTGSPQMLMLNQKAARRLGYWDDARPYAPARIRGIGGTGPISRTIRAGSVEMGGAKADRPLVILLGNDAAGEGTDAILGLSFIRRFNLSIDTAGKRLWVKPSIQPAVPERYALAGVWLDKDGSRIVVRAVGAGSPAARAGIAVGDAIVEMTWDAALAAIGGVEGKTVRLKVERDGTRRDVDYILAPFL